LILDFFYEIIHIWVAVRRVQSLLRKGVAMMVTWNGLFEFISLLLDIAALVYIARK